MRLLAARARHPSGEIFFDGEDLLHAPEDRLRDIRGARISMVFQEPMTSLNPLHTIGRQVAEILTQHGVADRDELRRRVIEGLTEVGIRDPEGRLGAYPHQLSGGQRQRVMIAMALANCPKLFIADEPTTALDVTVQAQILALLQDLQQQLATWRCCSSRTISASSARSPTTSASCRRAGSSRRARSPISSSRLSTPTRRRCSPPSRRARRRKPTWGRRR